MAISPRTRLATLNSSHAMLEQLRTLLEEFLACRNAAQIEELSQLLN